MKNLTIGNISFESKDIWSPKPGMNIVNKSGIQRIADTFGISPKIDKVELIGNQYVVVVEAAYNGSIIQMIGTASDNNLANEIAKAFPIDMAYKRAVGKLCCEVLRREAGITDLFYSSDEMDNGLNQDMPENKSAPKRKRRTTPAIENVEEVTVETPVEEPAPVVEPVAEPEVVAAIESSKEAIAEEPVTETEEIVEEVTEEPTTEDVAVEEPVAEDVAAEEVPVEEPVEVEVVTEEVTIEEPVEVEETPTEEVVVEEVSETPVEVVEAEEVPAEDPESFWNEMVELVSTKGTVREIFENSPETAKSWALAKSSKPFYQRVTNLMRQAFKATGREDELK